MGARGLEQAERAGDVRLDERLGAVDGSVDMTFGGQVEHGVGCVFLKDMFEKGSVTNIAVDEGVVGVLLHVRQGCEVSGVGEGVEVDHPVPGGECKMDEVGADETAAACNENFHRTASLSLFFKRILLYSSISLTLSFSQL